MAAPARTRRRTPPRRWSATGTAIVLLLAVWLVQWLVAHPFMALGLLGTVGAGAAAWGTARVRLAIRLQRHAVGRLSGRDPQRMSPGEFEEFLAALCRRDGCTQVEVVGGAGDLAADVLYTDPYGYRGLIQAKKYKPGNAVGSGDVQKVNGTYREAHGCAHAAIVTTSSFTQAAREFAGHLGMPLVAGDRLARWARGDVSAAPWARRA